MSRSTSSNQTSKSKVSVTKAAVSKRKVGRTGHEDAISAIEQTLTYTKKPTQPITPEIIETKSSNAKSMLIQHPSFWIITTALVISGGAAIRSGGTEIAIVLYALNLLALLWYRQKGL